MATKSITNRAIDMVKQSARVSLRNLEDNPGARVTGRQVTKAHNKGGKSHKELQVAAKPPLGWIFGDFYRPWQRRFPSEPSFNREIHTRREYPPLSLLELQRLIDLGWINVDQPIDLTTLCNTYQYRCNPMQREFGVQLTDEGADIFTARVNIEVQWASELAIASIERNGGVITSAYYDPLTLTAVVDPVKFFKAGEPIPRRRFPPMELIARYTDPKLRGYLADPAKIRDDRIELAQKYGYSLPDITKDPCYEMLCMRKDPLQAFFGLEPGWAVNLKDKTVLKPLDERLIEYYNS